MIDTLKEIILDFQERGPRDQGFPRALAIRVVPNKATICIGVRRCGKSTYLFQIMQKLLDHKVAIENIIYINFFDDRLHNLKDLDLVNEAYFSIYPNKKNNEKVYYFLDELQVITNWEAFVDRVMRTENSEIYISGSSAQMLAKEIATQMRGRALSWELFPFSFSEFLKAKGVEQSKNRSTKMRLLIQKAFEEYWEVGSFPETLFLDEYLRRKIHQEYFQAILFRDLVERHDISHPKALLDLAYRLVDNVACLYSINKLTNYLKSQGHRVPKAKVGQYLEWFEDAYFLFSVHLFDASLSRSKANPKKIYCVDHAFVRSISSGILVGHLLENMVFIALRRTTSDIWYCRTQDGYEVDFLAEFAKRKRMLVQVCGNLKDAKTEEREIRALVSAMEEHNIENGSIVTFNESKTIKHGDRTILVQPIWRFLLNLSDVG